MDWYELVDATGYALSFCANEKYWPQMEKVFSDMAQSFTAH
jgi:hypothetical protein